MYLHGMGGMLTENIELAFKVTFVELCIVAVGTIAIVVRKNDKWLPDGWLTRASGGTEDGGIGWDGTPTEDGESKLVCNSGEDRFLLCLLVWVVWFEEDISDGVLAGLWEERAKFALCFALEEGVGNAGHDTSTVTIPAVCACSASVGHCTEKVASIGNNFVARFALDMAYETYPAGVSLVFWGVETLLGGEGRAPRVWITGNGIECVDDDGGVAVAEAGVVQRLTVAVAVAGVVLGGGHCGGGRRVRRRMIIGGSGRTSGRAERTSAG
jgi:hypothetical protein